jgi:hypothetical protein
MSSADIVAACLRVYWPNARTVLDPTWGNGRFWQRDVPVEVIGRDIVTGAPGGTCDVRALRDADNSFDVAVFDPPHIADGGRDGVMARRYGTYASDDLRDLVRDGSREVFRVGRFGCLIKVCDGVHGGKFVRMSRWVVDQLGEPFDVVHATRKRPLIDPKWNGQRHAYSNGSTFLVYCKDRTTSVATSRSNRGRKASA